VYINHSCEPSVIFDTSSLSIIAGPNGLKAGDELTFFYPSTEWDMAQGFSCFCGAKTCRGFISGAKNMSREQLEGNWLNAHIRNLLGEKEDNAKLFEDGEDNGPTLAESGNSDDVKSGVEVKDETEEALLAALNQARKMVDAAQRAVDIYKSLHQNGSAGLETAKGQEVDSLINSGKRRGVTSRELSGEMGGDTKERP